MGMSKNHVFENRVLGGFPCDLAMVGLHSYFGAPFLAFHC